jgi:uncharacterized protein YndB with AHSA1/START domain
MTAMAHSVDIPAPADLVFDFVADPRNDPRWCPRVQWCRQVAGDGPAPGARYETRHRPAWFMPSFRRRIELLELDRPRLVRSRQEDANGVFAIDYELEERGGMTRFTQRDHIDWRYPGFLVPLAAWLPPRNVSNQLTVLARTLAR